MKMSAVTIQQMADRVAGMLEERLGVRGKDLKTKARKAGRLVPRRVRDALSELADLAERAQNPKLLVQIDQARVAECYDICQKHLATLRPGGRRLISLAGVAASVAFGLLVLGLVVLAVQRMQGRI